MLRWAILTTHDSFTNTFAHLPDLVHEKLRFDFGFPGFRRPWFLYKLDRKPLFFGVLLQHESLSVPSMKHALLCSIDFVVV